MLDWVDRDKKNIWHPFTSLLDERDPIFIAKAEGIYLHKPDGTKIIDGISSWWVNLHGHSHPKIAQAIASQALQLEHVIFAGFTHQPAIELSERLLGKLPENFSKIFFSDNGSTAVEVAIKIAIQFWRNQNSERTKIIAIEGAYHGDTFGAMSVGDRSPFTAAFNPYLFDVDFLRFPSPENEQDVLSHFERLLSGNNVAAFIFEPLVQAAGGMRMYSARFLDQALAIAKKHRVIAIADEVFTGFYRTGKMFAIDHLTHKPHLIALSKGITGGTLPLGVTACDKELLVPFLSRDVEKTFYHGHSFTANPLSCAASLASLDLLDEPTCHDHIKMINEMHMTFAADIKQRRVVRHVRVMGVILAIELETDNTTSYFNEIRRKIYGYFLDKNILLRPLGNVVYVLPPYVIRREELQSIFNAIKSFLDLLEAELH